MTESRKRVLAGILVAAMALTGVLIGTVSADDQTSGGPHSGLMARVAEILGIDQSEVEDAFQQAVEEQRQARRQQMEAARETRMQQLVEEGVLTQEEADEWEAWMESRPDNRDEMREWFESRPDIDCYGIEGMPRFEGRAGGGAGRMPGRPGGAFGQFGGSCPEWGCPAAPEVE